MSREECSFAPGPDGSALGARTVGPDAGEPILGQPSSLQVCSLRKGRTRACSAERRSIRDEPISQLVSRLAIALLAVMLLGPASAQAQDDEARSLFEQGTTAVHEGRFADARIALERSLSLSPRAPTAFNLVVALRGMGELVAASDVCTNLLAGRYGEIAPAQREEAMPLCDAARVGIAHLAVRVGGEATLELRVDGVAVGEAAPGELVEQELDPGAHVVTIVSMGHPPIDRTIELAPGARTELELVGPAASRPSSEPDLGLVLGLSAGGAALVAAIVIVAVVASQPSSDGDYPVIATLLRF